MEAEERKMRLMEMAVHLTAATIAADARPTGLGRGEFPGNTKAFLRAVYEDIEDLWKEIGHTPPP